MSTAVTGMWDFKFCLWMASEEAEDPPQRPDPQTEQEVRIPNSILQVEQKTGTETRSPGHLVGFERGPRLVKPSCIL